LPFPDWRENSRKGHLKLRLNSKFGIYNRSLRI
jgi:hypothetical protein